MAKLRVIQTIVNDNYNFTFDIDLDSISDDDLSRVKKFGAPSIDFGGAISSGGVSYNLPSVYYKFHTDFPVKISFSPTVAPFDSDTMNKLTAYLTIMTTRITAAITTLRAEADTFTGEHLTNI